MKWALILGASGGLGLATAQRLAQDGFALALVYRESRKGQGQVQMAFDELRAQAPDVADFNVNALSEEGVRSVVAKLTQRCDSGARIAVVVHSIAHGSVKAIAGAPSSTDAEPSAERNAGGSGPSVPELFDAAYRALKESRAAAAPGRPLDTRDVQLTIDAMGINIFTWVRALLDAGLLASDTRVIGLTSEGARRIWIGYAAVAAAKATLEALVRAMAVELGPLGIRANLIQAGITDTRSLRMIPEQELLRLSALHRNPLGRLTRPSDVANAVSLLCRPEAAWVNGATLAVDGGESLC